MGRQQSKGRAALQRLRHRHRHRARRQTLEQMANCSAQPTRGDMSAHEGAAAAGGGGSALTQRQSRSSGKTQHARQASPAPACRLRALRLAKLPAPAARACERTMLDVHCGACDAPLPLAREVPGRNVLHPWPQSSRKRLQFVAAGRKQVIAQLNAAQLGVRATCGCARERHAAPRPLPRAQHEPTTASSRPRAWWHSPGRAGCAGPRVCTAMQRAETGAHRPAPPPLHSSAMRVLIRSEAQQGLV